VAVILLFIGLAVAPSINANVSKETLVELTTEVCGLNGGKQTVRLTQQEAEEVKALFYLIRERLNATESREEAEEIFKEAVVELDKYGLLGGMSVKQAQKLVTGGYKNQRAIKILEKLYTGSQADIDSNILCLIAGRTSTTVFIPILPVLLLFLMSRLEGNLANLIIALIICSLPTTFISYILPVKFFNAIAFGVYIWGVDYYNWTAAEGWINTIGLLGMKKWDGSYYGDIIPPLVIFAVYYTGAIGFTGIRLNKESETYYLGSALYVKLTTKTPIP